MGKIEIQTMPSNGPTVADSIEPGAVFARGAKNEEVALVVKSADNCVWHFLHLPGPGRDAYLGSPYPNVPTLAKALEQGGWKPADAVLGVAKCSGWPSANREAIWKTLLTGKKNGGHPLSANPGETPMWMGQPVDNLSYSELFNAFLNLASRYNDLTRGIPEEVRHG